MNKTMATLITLLTIAGAGAVIIASQINNQTITLLGNFEAYIDNQRLLTGDTLDWGTHRNTFIFSCNLSVLNTDNVTRTHTLYITNMPIGWKETWIANATAIEPDFWANGTLTLTIPTGTKGTFSFGNMTLVQT